MRILFLYTELADYFLKCCEALSNQAEVSIIRWPVNKEAPFQFHYSDKINVFDKEKYSVDQLFELVEKINPEMIICSGWVDKDYLKIAKKYYSVIPTVLTCDTHWRGDLKQYLAVILSRFFLLNRFSHAWVPGKPQRTYLQKLGFKPNCIVEGFYSCDLPRFNALYDKQFIRKQDDFPKRFLFVGRYYEFKGLKELWEAFVQVQLESPNDWELWCLGTGDLAPIQHPKIKHFGFVQPKDLEPILSQCGVFVLPSRFEPWGVVVHEYAAAGFPLLVSQAVGAAEAFVDESNNGFVFSVNSITELKKALKKIINLSSKELILMAQRSHELAQSNSPDIWASKVKLIYDERKK